MLLTGGPTLWRSWGQLLHSVRTGAPAFDHAHGVDFFGYFRQHPEERAVFDQTMAALTRHGGAGAGGRVRLRAGRHGRGCGRQDRRAGDRAPAGPPAPAGPRVRPAGRGRGRQHGAGDAGLGGRGEAVGGDFFAAVPAGGDAYLLKFILHDWDDDRCVAILRACRRAMSAAGRLLVVELQVPPGAGPSFAKSQDVNMLVNLGGRERTEAEYRALFAAGFGLTRTLPIQGELHVLEGAPV